MCCDECSLWFCYCKILFGLILVDNEECIKIDTLHIDDVLVVFISSSNSEYCITEQELSRKRLSLELAKEKTTSLQAKQKPPKREGSVTAAAVGASLGAGLGIVMAVIMGAASALRKP
jgi:hypothetical protein